MNLLELWVHTPAAIALGRTLAHSLWEGAMVALILFAALGTLRSSRVRYAAACVAMLAMLAAFGYTFQRMLADQRIPIGGTAHVLVLPPAPSRAPSPDIVTPSNFHTVDYLPWLAPFWIAGVLCFHLRGVASWLAARRLRRTGVCVAARHWQSQADRLAARVRLSRPVTLLESCLAEVPVVIGYVRPVILMPVGLLAGMPAEQVEAILLHELAHIRRHDYVVNLLQIVVESLVFYHPAVWWISGTIRAERENCCDDVVVATQGDALAYAAALTALEFHRGETREAVLAVTGGSLVKRVRRLLVQPEGPRATLTPVLSAAILTISAAAVLTAWQTAPPPPPVPAAPPAPAVMAAPAVPKRPPAPAAQNSPAVPAVPPAPATPSRKGMPPVPPPPPAPPAPVLLAQVRKSEPSDVPMDNPYRKWMTQDVAYIITDAERSAFKNLQSNEEREHFIEQFWLRRDPTPGTVENKFKEEIYRRIAYANANFASNIAGWKTDRGRIYIVYGPPDQKESHPAGGYYQRPAQEGGGTTVTYPFEQWMYRWIDGVGTNVIIEFVDPDHTGEYRMTMDPSEKDALGLIRPPGESPVSAKAGATVQRMGVGATLISVPLSAYADHKINVTARVFDAGGKMVTRFEDSVQGPAPLYTKIVPLAIGKYRVEVVVKDGSTSKFAGDLIEFEVK